MGWSDVEGVIARALSEGVAPGAELCVLHRGTEVFHLRQGLARRAPEPRALGEGTWWDLASLTKPLVGAALTLSLVADRTLSFGLPVRQVLPDAPAGVTVAQLLTHSAGYPAWRPLYRGRSDWGSPETRAAVLEEATTTPLVARPGEVHTYSDIGFVVLCRLLETVGGDRLDRLWQRRLAGPLGWSGLGWQAADVAATERCEVRGRVIEGQVHDLNAAAMGGISTHAGLFGTARGVAVAAQDCLEGFHGRGPLAGQGLRFAWTHGGAGSHRYGWDGITPGSSSTGRTWEPGGVGHLGFTGTSLWVAPTAQVVVVLLTNRVHPDAGDPRIRQLRPAVHEAVVRTLSEEGRWAERAPG